MAKPKTPNQKRKYSELNKRLAKYVMLVESIYEDLNLEAAKIVGITDFTIDSDRPFMWSDYPQTRKRIRDLQERFVEDIGAVIYSGTSEEWKNSNEVQDLLANKVLQTYGATIGKKNYEILYQPNNDALKAFQQRKDKGFTISDKLWNQSTLYKQELEEAISCAIQKGTSAIILSKQISKYLLDFPQLQKDYKERFGKASRSMDCEYRSIRLAASEINMAYRQAENLRWQQMDFVVGYEIKLSNNHTCNGKPFQDICDILAGKYPKDFQWTGWHPLCYSDDSEVLTNRGWKLFKDVLDDDLILSLNPNTRNIEWVEFIDRQCFSYYGEMIHFYNRSLDCLVTPEHNMVYLNKNDGKIKNCQAKEYTKGKGRFYRGCEYESGDVEFYQIDDLIIPFDLFCEFMGYWLSDGSTMSNSGVVISQQEGETARDKIVDCIKRMGFEPHLEKQKVVFYNTTIRNYLKIFGRCINKFVPYVIKNASKRQIRIFLDAFVLCDGYKRPCRSFIGNHGNEFKSDKDEIIYFTTSERMAGDLSELILKSGHRPSFSINKAGVSHKANGPIIKSNYDCYSIRECYSVTSSVFNKEIQHYDGLVYDLTLERNHIMYIRRNGKCFWGSNCRCYKIPILKTEEEFWEWDGRSEATTASVNEVKDVPDAFKKWVLDNQERISTAKKRNTLPYFLRDNKSVYQKITVESSISEIVKRASSVGDEVQSTAERIAIKNGGYVTPINFKSTTSITRKVITEGITPYDIKDAVRTTIIVPKSRIEDVLEELHKTEGFLRLKRQKPESFMGYSGNIVNIRTTNGLTAEIQVNTERMIYAKERPEDAKRILGKKRWEEIHNETGMEGGLGHKYYEQWRILDKSSNEALKIVEKSIEYYSHFR
ncbi:hypothetical protein [Barnesiella intestinihominis]|uniref:hypothetical protein n=1 Tax=Barnesiella intestinihominis TaxID=487174 RepID=UPI002FD8E410